MRLKAAAAGMHVNQHSSFAAEMRLLPNLLLHTGRDENENWVLILARDGTANPGRNTKNLKLDRLMCPRPRITGPGGLENNERVAQR